MVCVVRVMGASPTASRSHSAVVGADGQLAAALEVCGDDEALQLAVIKKWREKHGLAKPAAAHVSVNETPAPVVEKPKAKAKEVAAA